MNNFFVVFIGAGMGGMLRYWLQLSLNKAQYTLPMGTIVVNLLGCFAIGLICGICEVKLISKNLNALLIPGILGGFTTFSAFSIETIMIIQKNELLLAVTNILVSVIGGIAFAYLGYRNIRLFIS
jgi:CrcB protein